MLNSRQLATLRAALLYWEEELGPHGPTAMQPYFAPDDPEPLSVEEIRQLRDELSNCQLRYLVVDESGTPLPASGLFSTHDLAAMSAPGSVRIAAVLIATSS